MKVINIKVTDKLRVASILDGENVLSSDSPVKIASGNYKSIILNFVFDSTTWTEKTLRNFATFNIDGKEKIQVELEQIDKYQYACYIPYSVCKKDCKVNIGVYGMSTYNDEVVKIVSTETLYFLVIDGSFSAFITDETPLKVETVQEQLKEELNEYSKELEDSFNTNYEMKINNLNANILTIEENAEETTGITFGEFGDSKRIENAISNYFALTPDDKIYTVRFPLFETSNTCNGEKLDDNIDKYVNLATDTIREESNYSEAWQSIDCNAVVDDNGVRHITALKGMSTFKDTGKVDVFCLFRTYYQKIWEEDGYLYISRTFVPREGYTIVPQAVNKDGSYNQWFVIGKYAVGDILEDDGTTRNVYSSKGLVPSHSFYGNTGTVADGGKSMSISHTGCMGIMKRKGKYYSAGLMSDYMHILTTFYLKFATRNTQSIMAGNTSNNFQYQVAVAESNTNRVVLTTSQANNIDLYTCVSVGDRGSNTNNDRNYAYMHNVAYNARVIGKEVVDDTHTALIIDRENITTTDTTYVSTMHEISGYSDYILGRNGSIGSNTNGKHGMVLDGIEIAVGGYEVAGNMFTDILDATTGKQDIYYTNDVSKLTSNMTTAKSTYKKSHLAIQPTKFDNWNYITKMEFDVNDGLAIPTEVGGTGSGTSVGYADGVYIGSGTGQREFLWLGHLYYTTNAGLSCAHTYHGVSSAYWYILARLSINGVGGELAE